MTRPQAWGRLCVVAVGCMLMGLGCGGKKKPTNESGGGRARTERRQNLPDKSESAQSDFDPGEVPGRIHRVLPADTLWNLSERYYGDGKHWRRIMVANRNRLTDPADLPVGMVLIIP